MKIQVTKEKTGYSASIAELSVYTEGETFEELVSNLEEAVSLRFEGEKKRPRKFPMPYLLKTVWST